MRATSYSSIANAFSRRYPAALAQRLAASQLTVAWLQAEDSPASRDIFFREAAGYQQAFGDHAYFAASATSNRYYSNGPGQQARRRAT